LTNFKGFSPRERAQCSLAQGRTGATVGGMVGRAAGLALVLMLVQNSGFVLVMRYSRHQQQGENAAQYNPAVVVAMQEALQAGLTPSPSPKPKPQAQAQAQDQDQAQAHASRLTLTRSSSS
jgi:hypothetical protein